MSAETILVTLVLSIGLVIVAFGGWVWIAGKVRRRKRGLPAPDRSCERNWYSVGNDAK